MKSWKGPLLSKRISPPTILADFLVKAKVGVADRGSLPLTEVVVEPEVGDAKAYEAAGIPSLSRVLLGNALSLELRVDGIL
jgi:hypothetical protein